MNPLLQIALSNLVLATAMAIVVALVTRFWRNRHAAHLLWMLVLIKLVTPPMWNVPLAIGDALRTNQVDALRDDRLVSESGLVTIEPASAWSSLPPIDLSTGLVPLEPTTLDTVEVESSANDIAAMPSRVSAATTASEPPLDWSRLVLAAWIAASSLWLIVAIFRIARFHRLVRRSPAADSAIKLQVERLGRRLGLRCCPTVRVLEGNVSPMVWPLTWKRSLLLPRKLLEELTPSQLDTVIAHELAHLVRRDDLVRFLEAGVTCLFWWNPVVWWARRELRQAEEDCCDALVVCALPESRRQYGEALLRAAEIVTFGRSLPALASAFAQQRFLKRRIEMILMHEFRRGLSWPFKLLLLAVAAAILPLAATAVSQDVPGTAESTAADPEASQFGVQTTAAQPVDPNNPAAQNAFPASAEPATGTTVPQTSSAANRPAPAGSTDTVNTLSRTPIVALPGSDLIGGFSWQDPHTTTVRVGNEREWTFVDLDTGTSEQLGPYEVREPAVEARGYDIRLRSWADDINGRTEFVAVLLDIAYQDWRNGLDGLTGTDLLRLAQAASRSDAIHPGNGIFRTSEGKLGVLEFTTEDGTGTLKYQLIAGVDPVPATRPDSTLSETSSIPRNVATESSVSSSDAQIPARQSVAVEDPTPAFRNDSSYEPAELTPSTESSSTTDWPTQRAGGTNNPVQPISTDPEVQQLELELLTLDIESIQIRLEGEQKKLDNLRQLFEQGVEPEGEYQAQQVAVHLLQIELRRASIRRELYQAQIERLQGVDFSESTPSPSNPPSNDPYPTIDVAEPTGPFGNPLNPPTLDEYQIPQADPAVNPVTSPAEPEAYFPRPVDPEGPLAIVRGVIVEQGKPVANRVIWIIGEQDGETVLYQDGPSGEDGTFEFSDVPVGRPWRVFIPYENGPWGFDSGTSVVLNDVDEASIEVVVAGDTVTMEVVDDAPRAGIAPR